MSTSDKVKKHHAHTLPVVHNRHVLVSAWPGVAFDLDLLPAPRFWAAGFAHETIEPLWIVPPLILILTALRARTTWCPKPR